MDSNNFSPIYYGGCLTIGKVGSLWHSCNRKVHCGFDSRQSPHKYLHSVVLARQFPSLQVWVKFLVGMPNNMAVGVTEA